MCESATLAAKKKDKRKVKHYNENINSDQQTRTRKKDILQWITFIKQKRNDIQTERTRGLKEGSVKEKCMLAWRVGQN